MGITGSLTGAVIFGIIAGRMFVELDGTLSDVKMPRRALCIWSNPSSGGYLVLPYEKIHCLTLDTTVCDRARGLKKLWVVPRLYYQPQG